MPKKAAARLCARLSAVNHFLAWRGYRQTSLRHLDCARTLGEIGADKKHGRPSNCKSQGAASAEVVWTPLFGARSTLDDGPPARSEVFPFAIKVAAMACGLSDAHVDRAAWRPQSRGPTFHSPRWPTRGCGERYASHRSRLRQRVPIAAAPANAAVIPGTTCRRMPAASSAAISPCARPKSRGRAFERPPPNADARGVDQALLRRLHRGVAAAALADLRRSPRAWRAQAFRDMDERVMKNDVGQGEQPRGAQREQIRSARPCADEIDGTR